METNELVEPLQYPVLMEYISKDVNCKNVWGVVVLFTGLKTGMIVHSTSEKCPAGQYADTWIRATTTSDWQFFHGKVTLAN